MFRRRVKEKTARPVYQNLTKRKGDWMLKQRAFGWMRPQPLTLNPQPSTLNPQPSTLNPGPDRWGGGDGSPQEDLRRQAQTVSDIYIHMIYIYIYIYIYICIYIYLCIYIRIYMYVRVFMVKGPWSNTAGAGFDTGPPRGIFATRLLVQRYFAHKKQSPPLGPM